MQENNVPEAESRVHLMDFPNEVLDHIASFLDADSVAAMGLANHRLFNVTTSVMKKVKTTVITPRILDHLTYSGQWVHSLDLSDCSESAAYLTDVILKCRNIKELSVLNSQMTYEDVMFILVHLPKLEILKFSIFTPPTAESFEFAQCIPLCESVKKLYIEAAPGFAQYKRIIDAVNKCVSIEQVHIRLVGKESHACQAYNRDPIQASRPAVLAERWTTLHTFTCCSCFGNRAYDRSLLTFVFARHESEIRDSVAQALNQPERCHKFERGVLRANCYEPKMVCKQKNCYVDHDIKNFMRLKLSTVFDSVRPELDTLTQLDLSGCHDLRSEIVLPILIDTCKSLRSITFTACFFYSYWGPNGAGLTVKDKPRLLKVPTRKAERVIRLLKQLKLKTLVLKGDNKKMNRYEPCKCQKCSRKLTSFDIVRLDELDTLEELYLTNAEIDDSFYGNLVTSKAHTIKLCLNYGSGFVGLRNFIQRCRNLENFKLDSPELPLGSKLIWEALAEAKKLKQLCIGSNSLRNIDPRVVDTYLPGILKNLDMFHLHMTITRNRSEIQQMVNREIAKLRSAGSRSKMVFVGAEHPSLWPLKSTELFQHFPGRTLCCPDVANASGKDIKRFN